MSNQCKVREFDLAAFEIFEQELKSPSAEFQAEYRGLVSDPQKQGELKELLEKKAPLRTFAFELDKKQEPKKDIQKSDPNESNGNSDGKLQLSEFTDKFLKDKFKASEELLSKDREQAQCQAINIFKDTSEELEKKFPSIRKRVESESVVDLSPLLLDPKDINLGGLLPDLDKFPDLPSDIRSLEHFQAYEKENQFIANSGMSADLQRLILTDAELFKVYRTTQAYVLKYNVPHSDTYNLTPKERKSDSNFVYVDTKLDRSEAELAERDGNTPLQYLRGVRESIPQLAVTAYLLRQRLGLIHATQETGFHVGYFDALYRLSPSLFEKDTDLRAVRAVLRNQDQSPEVKELFAKGVFTETEFNKAIDGIPKLGNPTKRKELWKKALSLQGKVLQPFHLWPSELSAKVGELEKEERSAIEGLELGESDRQMARVMKGLVTAENAKYFQELCEVGSVCKNNPEKKDEIWNAKIVGHSKHPEAPEGIYDKLTSIFPHLDAWDTKRVELRASERHTALEAFRELLRSHPDYSVDQAVADLKKTNGNAYQVLDQKMYLSERVRLSKLSEEDYGLQRVEFAKKLRRGVGTESDPERVEADPVYIDGESVRGRNLETYLAELELKDVESSYPEGVAVFKGNSLNALLDQLSPEDKQWYLNKKKAIEFEGASADLDEIYERIGKKYVGFIEYLESDVSPKLPTLKQKDPDANSLYFSSKAAFLDSDSLTKGDYPDLTEARKVFGSSEHKLLPHKLDERELAQKLSIEGYLVLTRFLLASAEEAKTAGVGVMIQEMATKVFKDRDSEFKKFLEFAWAERPIKAKEEELLNKFALKTGKKLLKSYVQYVGRVQANPPQPKATASRLTGKTENGFFCPIKKDIEGLTGFGALIEVGFSDKTDQDEIQRLIKKQIPEDNEPGGTTTASLLLPSLSDFFLGTANAESLPLQKKSENPKNKAAEAIKDRADYIQLVRASRLSEENKKKLETLYDNMSKTAASVLAKEELAGLLGRRKYNFNGSNAALDVANFKIHNQGGVNATLYNGGLMRGFGLGVYLSPAVVLPLASEFMASAASYGWMRLAKKQSDYGFMQNYVKFPLWGKAVAGIVILGLTIALPAFESVREYGCEQMRTSIPQWSDDARSNAVQEVVQMGESLVIAGYASEMTLGGIKKGWHEVVIRRGGTAWRYAGARLKGGEAAGARFWRENHLEGPLDLVRMRGKKTHWERLLEKARAQHPQPLWIDKIFERSHNDLTLELAEGQRLWRQAKSEFDDVAKEIERLRQAGQEVPANLTTIANGRRDALMTAQEKTAEAERALLSSRRVGAVGESYPLSEKALEELKPIYERKDFLNKQLEEARKEIPVLRKKIEDNEAKYRAANPNVGDDLSKMDGEFKETRDGLRTELEKHIQNQTQAEKELAAKSKEWNQKIKDTYLKTDEAMQKAAAEAQAKTKWSQVLMTKIPLAMNFYDWAHSTIVNPINETADHFWLVKTYRDLKNKYWAPMRLPSHIRDEAISKEDIEEADGE